MSHRINLALDDDTKELFDANSDVNHSEEYREFLRLRFSQFQSRDAIALEARKRALREKIDAREKEIAALEAERDEYRDELERLEAVEVEEPDEEPVEAVAEQMNITDPTMATKDNPAIQKHATEHGVNPSELAEAVRENVEETSRTKFASLSDDD